MKRALSFGSFDFNPHWFHKPAFYMYLLFFEYGLYFFLGKIAGLWVSTSEFAVQYVRNPGPFYMIGRFTTVLFSVGSIWLVYQIGKRHFKPGVGLASALILSLTFGHVVSSQDIKADTPTVFFTIASMLFLLNYVDEKKWGALFASVVMAGIGTATKEYSLVMLPSIMLGMAFVFSKEIPNKVDLFQRLFLTGLLILVVFFLVFFICSPYNFLDPLGRKSTKALEVFFKLFGTPEAKLATLALSENPSFFSSVVRYIALLFSRTGLGWFIGSLSFLGLAFSIVRLNKKMTLFLLFPFLFTLISNIASPSSADTRHQLPLFPFLSILAAYFVTTLAHWRQRYRQVVSLGFCVLLVVPLLEILAHGYDVSKPDTRNVAKVWIESNLSSGTKLLLDENGPQLLKNEIRLLTEMEGASEADQEGQFTAHYDTYLSYQLIAAKGVVAYDLSYIRFPWWRESYKDSGVQSLTSERDRDMGNPLRPVGVDRYEDYVAQGFDYAIVQSNEYGGFFRENSRKAKRFPAFARLYAALFEHAVLLKTISVETGDYVGPTVKIFKFVPKGNQAMSGLK